MLGLVTAVLLVGLFSWVWWSTRNRSKYWEKQGIYSPPSVFFLGHFLQALNINCKQWEFMAQVHKEHPDSKVIGFYGFGMSPMMSIKDPELVQAVMIKDFDHFVDRRSVDSKDMGDDTFHYMLTNIEGSEWKETRSIMTPTFTSGKMKNMFYLLQEKAECLVETCKLKSSGEQLVDMNDLFSKYTMDVIASCAFGLEMNSLKNENEKFMESASELSKFGLFKVIKLMFFLIFVPKRISKFFRVQMWGKTDYFVRLVKQTIALRKESHKRGDFMDLMLDSRKTIQEENTSGKVKATLSEQSIISQSVLFILAGYDTTANTLCFAILLLAKHPKYQELLRAELIERMKLNEDGDLSYHDIMESKYLEVILAETLRLYCPTHILERKCTKEYSVPGTSVTLSKGAIVTIPVWAIHRDERNFDNPEEFRPERFFPENKHSILPGTYLPFGLGPRMCIATRFAQMESKLALAKMVLNFNISPAEGCEEIKLGGGGMEILKPAKDSVKLVLKEVDKLI